LQLVQLAIWLAHMSLMQVTQAAGRPRVETSQPPPLPPLLEPLPLPLPPPELEPLASSPSTGPIPPVALLDPQATAAAKAPTTTTTHAACLNICAAS
jgi:hypothetical protein